MSKNEAARELTLFEVVRNSQSSRARDEYQALVAFATEAALRKQAQDSHLCGMVADAHVRAAMHRLFPGLVKGVYRSPEGSKS